MSLDCHLYGKVSVNSLDGHVSWVDRVSGDLQGRANSIIQVDGVSDIAPACWLCGCVGIGFRKGTVASSTFLQERKLSPSSHLDARYFSSSLYAPGAFQAATLVLELRGSKSE